MSTVTGDDDGSFLIPLPFNLVLGSTNYNQIFYSTNATVTFGQADGAYWDYPQTPSISVAGRDWVSFGEGAYTSYGYNQDSFCIEWSVRPFPQSTGPLTQMRLVVNKFPSGNWHGEITTMTDLPPNARRGIRYDYGQPVVTMEAAFDVGNAGIPVEVEPQPTPSSFDEPIVIPTPVPSQTPEPEPTASVEPTLNPEPTPSIEPTQSVTPNPEPQQPQQPEPTVEPSQQPSEPSPEPTEAFVQPSETPLDLSYDNNIIDGLTEEEVILNELLTEYGPMDAVSFEDFETSGLDYEDLPDDQPVALENGVILFAEVADALEMFENPSEILSAIFTDPGKALTALANVGADMTPEKREESQIVVVASIIAAQILSTSNVIGRIR